MKSFVVKGNISSLVSLGYLSLKLLKYKEAYKIMFDTVNLNLLIFDK